MPPEKKSTGTATSTRPPLGSRVPGPTPPGPTPPGPTPPGPTPPVPGKPLNERSDAEVIAELRRAEEAEAGKVAAADQSHNDHLQEEMNDLAGIDLDFDIEALITDGAIAKENILLIPGPKPLYCDMHTLTKGEDLLAERLIVECLGLRTMGREHSQARGTAMIAMAITRFNNTKYPNPDPLGERDAAWQAMLQEKVKLFKSLIKASAQVSEALALIYQNLGHAEMLNEDTKKKSPSPQ